MGTLQRFKIIIKSSLKVFQNYTIGLVETEVPVALMTLGFWLSTEL